jgi:hypothetical protein
VHGAVLVVDGAVWVVAIGLADEARGGGQIGFAPGTELEICGQIHVQLARSSCQRLHQEEAAIDSKSGGAKGRSEAAGGMEKQLRLDAVDMRRVEQQLEEVPQEHFFASVGRAGGCVAAVRDAGKSEDVADHRLGLLVDAEDVAGDIAGLHGGVAGQHAVVQVLHQQAG